MQKVVTILFVLSASINSLAQTNQQSGPKPDAPLTRQRAGDLPLARRNLRPKLTLQRALKLAENYAAKEGVDLSPYYLYQAKYILYGDEDKQEPCWFFWWVKEGGGLGNYVEIIVPIDSGNVRRLPSM
jgi:hypothetical protein